MIHNDRVSRNIDRYFNQESYDLQPIKVLSVFQSANNGVVKKQSRLANELTENDPAIAQAWSVRVAAIASCAWEIVGGSEQQRDFMEKALRNIQPAYDKNLVSFHKLLTYLQSSVLHGFAVSQTDWDAGGKGILGFRNYSQSLFSFQNSDLPYFVGSDYTNIGDDLKITPTYPRWIYHTSTNSRESEPLRSGIVRPLAYLYAFRRHVQIEYLRGMEKYGIPMPFANVKGVLYDENNPQKAKIEQLLADWTYDGYAVFDEDVVDIQFPTKDANFNADNFLKYLEWTEKQVFRIILGQDSTSSADNSNRSTAQVHNLIRGDMLASDAAAVEETVNTQIIKPLFESNFGASDDSPVFKFRLKGVSELQEMAKVVETLDKAGYETDPQVLSERFGFTINKKEVQSNAN
ncbi:MAG TPA: DUF935 family protein [Flavobacteriales bacterium]|nr:DUF935 family protein [Flavobacteriales bacterium]